MRQASRRIVVIAVMATALASLALIAACAMNTGPGKEYRARTASMDAPALYRERLELVQTLRTLDAERGRLAPDAAETKALDARRENTAEKLAHVNELLAKGDFPVHELRYKINAPTLAANPTSPSALQAKPEPVPNAHSPAPTPRRRPEPAAMAEHNETPSSAEAAEAPPASVQQATVTAVLWTQQDSGIAVTVQLSAGATGKYRTFSLDSPRRHVLDVLDVTQPPVSLPSRLPVESPAATAIRIGWHPDKQFVRIVVDGAVSSSVSAPQTSPEKITFSVSP